MNYGLVIRPGRRPICAAREVTSQPIEGTDGLLSTVYNVEICATGIEYPLASGPATFTPEDLVEAVASQKDPAIQAPRVWLGHPDDDRFHAGRATPAGSAEPALGKVISLRVEDEGQTLVGDIVGCPTWLAKILSSAYPNRSIEGFQGATTITNHEWGLVITDLALLGVTWPGVTTLADLQALYSEEGPDGIEVEETMTLAARRGSVTGQVDVDEIRRAFYKSLAAGAFDELGPWSWVRAIQIDPHELIVDDEDSGEMFRVPFTSDEKDGATFGEVKKVKIQYVNATALKNPEFRSALAGGLMAGRQIAASWKDRAESRPESTKEDPMTPEQLRASIGLQADATDDEVRAKLAELNAAAENPSPDQVPDPNPTTSPNPNPPQAAPEPDPGVQPGSTTDPGTPEVPSPDQQPTPEQVAASLQAMGMVAVPRDAWTGVQTTVQSIAADREKEDGVSRTRDLDDAIRAGKVFPHQREYYQQRLDDPNTRESFRHLLTASVEQGGLAPNLVPVVARGADPAAADLSAEAYPASWLPEVQAQGQVAQTGPITMEGAR